MAGRASIMCEAVDITGVPKEPGKAAAMLKGSVMCGATAANCPGKAICKLVTGATETMGRATEAAAAWAAAAWAAAAAALAADTCAFCV